MSINFTALASGALGFTLALAWNDAISKTIKSFFPPTDERAAARATLIYALVITILVIFVVAVINHTLRFVHRSNERNSERNSERNGRRREGSGAGPPAPASAASAPPATAPPDCNACAKYCGVAPLVRLWEPPRPAAAP